MLQPTVEEILKASGLTDEQIKALDAVAPGKILPAFTTVISTAAQEREAAENAKRLQAQQYDQDIAPALDKWANEKATYDTKIAAYDAALKAAKEGGFQVPDILAPANPNPNPTSNVGRNPSGQFVAGANPVPGSPQFVADFRKEAGAAIGSMLDLTWKYQSLHNGAPMPDSPTALIAEANAQRMDPITWAAKKYDFAGKEKAKRDADQKAHDDAIRKEAKEASDKEWAERVGSNPMIRQAETSRFTEVHKAVKEGTRPDPLKMPNREQRHRETQQRIQKEMAENATVQ